MFTRIFPTVDLLTIGLTLSSVSGFVAICILTFVIFRQMFGTNGMAKK
ncbi:MAG: hypothetical protein P4N59_02230 [Negativicutes bacterium]|nr:hypothetical protein [Negativicutes bacterium]